MPDEQPSGQGGTLRRVLGPFDATCIVIGAVIGVGIFFTPSRVAMLAGSSGMALIAWAIGGFIALTGALCFAELGSQYHRSAGQYEVLRDAYSPLIGFVFVFCNATAILSGSAAVVAMICATHIHVAATGHEPDGSIRLVYCVALVCGLMAANLMGVVWGARIQNVSVLAKIITLLAVAALAVTADAAHGMTLTPAESPARSSGLVAGVLTALVPVIFSYGGWQQALWIGGEIRDPARNTPRAIVGGMLIVTVVYILANWAYLSLLGHSGVASSRALAADAVSSQWPALGRRIIAAAVALSAFGVMNSQLLTGPRLVYGMARDGRFFEVFSRTSRRTQTPFAAILLIGCLTLVLLLVSARYADGVDKLLTGVVAIDGIFFVLTGAALFILRSRSAARPRTFSVPGYPLVPALFVLCEAGVLIGSFIDNTAGDAALIGAGWVLLGVAGYFTFFRQNRS